jgi:hypothetical protein
VSDTDALFDMAPAVAVEPVPVHDSPDRRRTRQQRQRIAQGRHPLANVVPGLRLHDDAVRSTDPAETRTGPTCGTCTHRAPGGFRLFPKCTRLESLQSRGAATDCRAWWPACTEHKPA